MTGHHPDVALILDYAAGNLAEGVALIVATHISLCPICTRHLAEITAIGGVLLNEEAPVACSEASLAAVLDRLDMPEIAHATATTSRESANVALLPPPLRRYVSGPLNQVPWRRVGRLFEEFRLPLASGAFKASLYRLPPGLVMPKHGHRGEEYSLVLAGGFRDGESHFTRGDFAAKAESDRHQPLVDTDGPCLSLVVQDAPVKLTGFWGSFVNPFLRL